MKRILHYKDDRSHELDSSFITGNGVTRNLKKFYWEFIWCWISTRPERKRLLTNWRIDHNLMNLVVEYLRAAPYLWGHLLLIGTVLSCIL